MRFATMIFSSVAVITREFSLFSLFFSRKATTRQKHSSLFKMRCKFRISFCSWLNFFFAKKNLNSCAYVGKIKFSFTFEPFFLKMKRIDAEFYTIAQFTLKKENTDDPNYNGEYSKFIPFRLLIKCKTHKFRAHTSYRMQWYTKEHVCIPLFQYLFCFFARGIQYSLYARGETTGKVFF